MFNYLRDFRFLLTFGNFSPLQPLEKRQGNCLPVPQRSCYSADRVKMSILKVSVEDSKHMCLASYWLRLVRQTLLLIWYFRPLIWHVNLLVMLLVKSWNFHFNLQWLRSSEFHEMFPSLPFSANESLAEQFSLKIESVYSIQPCVSCPQTCTAVREYQSSSARPFAL